MPTERITNQPYNPNAASATVTATMRAADGSVLDTKTITVDIPAPEAWWDFNACNIEIMAGSNDTTFDSTQIQTYSPDSNSIFYMTSSFFSGFDDEVEYQNITDEAIRTRFQNYMNSTDPRFGVTRGSYLNENTTGLIVIDIEEPLNFLSLGDRNTDGTQVKTDEEWTWFTQGIIRRLNILREFIPNAKIGIWRFGDVQNSGIEAQEQAHIRDNLFVANITYEGKKFYDAIDFISPVLYQYFSPTGTQGEINAYNRIVNGGRTTQLKNVVDALHANLGEKPVVVITSDQYEGGSAANTSALTPNSIEANYLIRDRVTNMFALWYAFTFEFSRFETYAQNMQNQNTACNFVIDRRPMFVSSFSGNLEETVFGTGPGINANIWRKTPLTAAPDDAFLDENQNGRLRFINGSGMKFALQNGFRRFSMNQITGLTNFSDTIEGDDDTAKIYPTNPYSGLFVQFAPDYGAKNNGSINGTFLSDFGTPTSNPEWWLPTPYTPSGEPDHSGGIGDSEKAWKFAIQNFKDEIDTQGIPMSEITLYCYTGWRPHYAEYDPVTNEPSYGNYDRTSLIIDSTSPRSPRVTFFDYGWWDPEIEGVLSLGFNAISFDFSSSVWADSGDNDSIIRELSSYGIPFMFEAIPLTDNGQTGELKKFLPFGVSEVDDNLVGRPDERYSAAAYWGLYPQFFSTQWLKDNSAFFAKVGSRRLENLYFNPQTTEIHAVFDYALLKNTTLGYNLTDDEIKQEMILAYQHGFVVSLGECNQNTPERNAFREWVLELNNGNIVTRPENPESAYGTLPVP